MFKSAKEFDAAVRRVVSCVNDGFISIDAIQETSGLTDDDFAQALMRAVDVGYIDGLNYTGAVGGAVMWSPFSPHVTYSGLQFIESWDNA